MSKKEELKKIYYEAIKAVLPKTLVKQNIKKYKNKKIFVFCVGKAGYDFGLEVENVLGKNIVGGIAISNKKGKLKYLKHFTSTHPELSKKSLKASKLLLKEIKKITKKDRFLFFLSGGASAMVELPKKNISLKYFKQLSSNLIQSQTNITQLNQQRKKLSTIKGGKLANNFKTKKGEVFVLSDVVGDDLNIIGSAPMNNGKFPHTIIGNNTKALKAAAQSIVSKVKKTKIITTKLEKTTQEAATYIADKIKKYDSKYESFCLLFGGETTTKVQSGGVGGRNQELALRLVMENCITKDISILCAGSDGIDGNSFATGAFVDSDIYDKIKQYGLDSQKYLNNSDSNSFFHKLGYDFITGKTGTNVMDFIIILKKKG